MNTFRMIFFHLLFLSGQAQSWCPPGAEWYFDFFMAFNGPGYVRMTYTDTVSIAGKTCEKIYAYAKTGKESYGKYYYTHTANDVVYLVNDPDFDTLYNFNAVPGDKWRMAPTSIPECNAGKVIVIDTGRRVIQGETLKWLRVHYKSTKVSLVDTIYERLGALECHPYTWHNICPHYSDADVGRTLRCYSDQQIQDFRYKTTVDCDYYLPVGIPESGAARFEIFPNPASNTVRIVINADLVNPVAVFTDVSGRTLRRAQVEAGGLVSTTELPAGIYMLSILSEGFAVHCQKLIIE